MNSVVNRLNLVGFYALWTIGIAALFCALSTYVTFTPDPYVRIHNPELSAYGPDMTTMMYHTQRRGPSAELRFDLDVELSSLFNWNVKQLFVWVTAEYPSSRYTNNTVTVWDTILYAEDKKEADMYLEDVVGKYRLTDMAGSIRDIPVTLAVHWQQTPGMGLFTLGGGKKIFEKTFQLRARDVEGKKRKI